MESIPEILVAFGRGDPLEWLGFGKKTWPVRKQESRHRDDKVICTALKLAKPVRREPHKEREWGIVP